jgi:hypothetical protein
MGWQGGCRGEPEAVARNREEPNGATGNVNDRHKSLHCNGIAGIHLENPAGFCYALVARRGKNTMDTARRLLAALAVLSLLGLGACILNPGETDDPKDIQGNSPVRQALTTKSAVVNNLVYAYFNRDIDVYRELLDDNFYFVFQDADLGNPDIPDDGNWLRDDDVNATTNLFNENFVDPDGIQAPADEIELQLFGYEDLDESSWDVYAGAKDFPDTNDWYETALRYHLEVSAGEDLYIADDRARFIVRPVEVSGKDEWRLVVWKDEDDAL